MAPIAKVIGKFQVVGFGGVPVASHASAPAVAVALVIWMVATSSGAMPTNVTLLWLTVKFWPPPLVMAKDDA